MLNACAPLVRNGVVAGIDARTQVAGNTREGRCSMLFAIGGLLLVIWLAALALKVTVGLVHLLLVVAAVLFVIGFIRGRTGRTPA